MVGLKLNHVSKRGPLVFSVRAKQWIGWEQDDVIVMDREHCTSKYHMWWSLSLARQLSSEYLMAMTSNLLSRTLVISISVYTRLPVYMLTCPLLFNRSLRFLYMCIFYLPVSVSLVLLACTWYICTWSLHQREPENRFRDFGGYLHWWVLD